MAQSSNHLIDSLIGKKILIVDDNPTNLSVIVNYLEEQGLTIFIARDGQSGLEKAIYAAPDLILLDVMMPGIDGFETCRLLKENSQTTNIPVIFMTALTETISKVQGFNTGAVDYVTKPIQQEEVLARVTTHLRLRDLTEYLEQKVAQRTAELDKAYQKLQRLDNAKFDFIQVVSHELRTPLAIIDGYAQVLNTYPVINTDPDLQELVAQIHEGSSRMLDIVSQTLDATKVDQGSLILFRQNVVLENLIHLVCQPFQEVVKTRSFKITCEGLSDLPPIWADPDLLSRLFYQLVINALKFTPDGGTIRITGQQIDPRTVQIVVCDTGIGIDPAHLELIFEKFYQTGRVELHSSGKTSFKGGGPGLGLAIAKGIAEAHGGHIWAKSSGYNESTMPGSSFFIRLPIA